MRSIRSPWFGRYRVLARNQSDQNPILDLFSPLIEQLPIPVDLAMTPSMRFKIDHLRDHMDGISREHGFVKRPIPNVDKGCCTHRRGRRTQPDQDRHPQHPVGDRLTKWATGCELMIRVQPIMISRQIRKPLNVLLLDRSRIALPAITYVQLFESQRDTIGNHREAIYTSLRMTLKGCCDGLTQQPNFQGKPFQLQYPKPLSPREQSVTRSNCQFNGRMEASGSSHRNDLANRSTDREHRRDRLIRMDPPNGFRKQRCDRQNVHVLQPFFGSQRNRIGDHQAFDWGLSQPRDGFATEHTVSCS